MTWGWLKPLLDAIVEWLEKKAKEPHTVENANTPAPIRRSWNVWLADKLRNKGGGPRQPE